MTIKDFVKGKKPECIAPRYKHCRVNSKKPYCLWCRKRLLIHDLYPQDKDGK